MTTIFYYQWIIDGQPFGIFSSKEKADKALAASAADIKITVENLKGDLYYYELPLDKLVIANSNVILDY